MKALALACVLLGSIAAQATDQQRRSILGRQPELQWPSQPDESLTAAPFMVGREGWKYPLIAGRLGPPFRSIDRWRDLREMYEATADAAPDATWRVKVFVFSRSEVVDRLPNAALRMRRSSLESPQLDDVARALVLFQAMAETASRRVITIDLDVEQDDDAVRAGAEPSSDPFGEKFARETIAPRVNGAPFDADDKVFRGPYQSVLFVHAGLVRSAGTVIVRDTPISGVAYFGGREGDVVPYLAEDLFVAWTDHVRIAAGRTGFHVPGDRWTATPVTLASYVPAPMWTALCEVGENDARYVERYPPLSASASPANLVGVPWVTLPVLAPVAAPEGWQGAAGARIGARNVVLAEPWLASEFQMPIVGVAAGPDSRPCFVVESSGPVAGKRVEELLGASLQPPVGGPALTPVASWPEEPSASGTFTAAIAEDPERGRAIEVREAGSHRRGRAVLADAGAGHFLFDVAQHPGLAISIRASVTMPYQLVFETAEGMTASIALGRPDAPPQEIVVTAIVPKGVILEADTWRDLRIRLSDLGLSGRIVRIALEPGDWAEYLERPSILASRIAVMGMRPLTEVDDATPLELLAPETGAKLAELAALNDAPTPEQVALLMAALTDRNETVRLNAAAALRRVQLPEAVAALADQCRSATPAIAAQAAQALAFQDTPESWAAIRRTLDVGPFEFNKQYAALALASQGQESDAAVLSTLMTARSWRARFDGARAVARLPGRSAAIVLMALLQELDPRVRLAVVQGANLEFELVNRRLLYLAVNDPSEEVRAASYRRLITSPNADFRADGYRGVRDESLYVRLALLDEMAEHPDPGHRDALRIAVTDARARVRARALLALGAQSDPVTLPEIENLLADNDPRVQAALVSVAKAQALLLPSETIQRLLASRDGRVAQEARDLLQ